MKLCAISDCESPARTRGWCKSHYMRWYRYGDFRVKRSPWSRWNPNPNPSYEAAHRRIKRAKGLASDWPCIDCGGRARDWSYNHRDPDERTQVTTLPRGREVTVTYSLNPDCYEPRCGACHATFDLRETR